MCRISEHKLVGMFYLSPQDKKSLVPKYKTVTYDTLLILRFSLNSLEALI